MIRGINQQIIFEDAEDNEKMLQTLLEVKAVSKCKIFAYCLMNNHYHIVLKVEEEGLEQIFKRLGSRYVYWYNLKYNRTGHLYQNRYKSEAIENDRYLLAVIRYVHQNPVKAGIAKEISDYPWSSYTEYIETPRIIDTDYIFSIMDKKEFESFSRKEPTEKALDGDESKPIRITDEDAKKKIYELSGLANTTEIQHLDKNSKKHYLKKFKEAGMTIRQINRLTGISKGIVERS
jgi:REP element-mobilizing transposase RayT